MKEKRRDKVPTFLRKLYNMLNKESLRGIISWNDSGESFEVHDRERFIEEILPRYFKHKNMNSFVRQLNMYDFKKNKRSIHEIKFSHSYFQRDHPEMLGYIMRQTNSHYVAKSDKRAPLLPPLTQSQQQVMLQDIGSNQTVVYSMMQESVVSRGSSSPSKAESRTDSEACNLKHIRPTNTNSQHLAEEKRRANKLASMPAEDPASMMTIRDFNTNNM